MSFLYQAALVPLDRPVTMPDDRGQPFTHTYTEDTFDVQRANAHNVKVCVGHDPDLEVGRLELLLTHAGWWRCTFRVDADIGDELKVGQPVSVGLAVMPSGNPILREVSLVASARIAEAQITRRDRLKPKPVTPRRSTPAPTATAPVIYRSAHPHHTSQAKTNSPSTYAATSGTATAWPPK